MLLTTSTFRVKVVLRHSTRGTVYVYFGTSQLSTDFPVQNGLCHTSPHLSLTAILHALPTEKVVLLIVSALLACPYPSGLHQQTFSRGHLPCTRLATPVPCKFKFANKGHLPLASIVMSWCQTLWTPYTYVRHQETASRPNSLDQLLYGFLVNSSAADIQRLQLNCGHFA